MSGSWIPVTEELPKDGVVVGLKKGARPGKLYPQILTAENGKFRDGNVFVADGDVTHWMPLPEMKLAGEEAHDIQRTIGNVAKRLERCLYNDCEGCPYEDELRDCRKGIVDDAYQMLLDVWDGV